MLSVAHAVCNGSVSAFSLRRIDDRCAASLLPFLSFSAAVLVALLDSLGISGSAERPFVSGIVAACISFWQTILADDDDWHIPLLEQAPAETVRCIIGAIGSKRGRIHQRLVRRPVFGSNRSGDSKRPGGISQRLKSAMRSHCYLRRLRRSCRMFSSPPACSCHATSAALGLHSIVRAV